MDCMTENKLDVIKQFLANGKILANRTCVIVKVQKAPTTTKSGVILPETQSEEIISGEVVAVGKGSYTDNGDIVPLEISKEDLVCFNKWSGKKIDTINDFTFFSVQYADVLCVVSHNDLSIRR